MQEAAASMRGGNSEKATAKQGTQGEALAGGSGGTAAEMASRRQQQSNSGGNMAEALAVERPAVITGSGDDKMKDDSFRWQTGHKVRKCKLFFSRLCQGNVNAEPFAGHRKEASVLHPK